MKTQNSEITPYEFWDLTVQTVPPRSRLYSLEPCGLDTPYVESLTSYITRLAQAHRVSVRTLMLEELAPLLRRQYISADGLHSLLRVSGQALINTGLLAKDFAQALESLTLRTDLSYLTMLSWSSALSPVLLLKSKKTWCPDCFAEWQAAEESIYEPLVWHIRVVTVCPRHKKPLIGQCPYKDCRATIQLLSTNSRVGYCPKCSRWLGIITNSEKHSPEQEELNWHIWISETVGQLLEGNTNLKNSSHLDNLPRLIALYRKKGAGGGRLEMERQLRIKNHTINQWEQIQRKPQLEPLLRLCYCCGISLYELLTLPPKLFRTRKLKIHFLPKTLGKYQKHRTATPIDTPAIKKKLEVFAASNETPLSMEAIAKRLGHTSQDIRKHFPDLCKTISRRYIDFCKDRATQNRQAYQKAVRRVILKIHSKGQYPTHDKVRMLLGGKFPLDYNLRLKYWREAIQELEQGRARSRKRNSQSLNTN